MRKSDMILKVSDKFELDLDQVVDILNFIEYNGMLPPCDNSCLPENYDEGVLFQGCNNEWEPEDDEIL